MGFFGKLKNWVRGKGFLDDEEIAKKEAETQKPNEQTVTEVQKTLPQVKEESQITITKPNKKDLPKVTEEIRPERRSLAPIERPLTLQEIKEEKETIAAVSTAHLTSGAKQEQKEVLTEKTRDLTITKEEKKKLNKITEEQAQQEINKAIDKIKTTSWNTLGGISNASDYWNQMKTAVIKGMRGAKEETIAQVADAIVAQPQLFRNRFDSLALITTDDGNQFQIVARGTLPHDFKEEMKEEGLNIGNSISPTDLNQITTRVETRLSGRSIGGVRPENTMYMQSGKTYIVTNVEYNVRFG